MKINEEKLIKILHTLAKVAINEAKSYVDMEDAMYWAGIKAGLDTAKYVITYGKPPETPEETAIAEKIGESILN